MFTWKIMNKSNAGFRLACHSLLWSYVAWSPLSITDYSSQRPRCFGFITKQNHSRVKNSTVCGMSLWAKQQVCCQARCFLPLGHSSTPSCACAVLQMSPSKQQCNTRLIYKQQKGQSLQQSITRRTQNDYLCTYSNWQLLIKYTENSYSISHLLGTVTTWWLHGQWQCSHHY